MQEMRPQQINIELPEEEAEGIYANLAMILHSPTEMIIDFARIMPRLPKAKVLSRIIMTPMNAKLLQQALTENIKQFEKKFGPIKLHGKNKVETQDIGFESSTHRVEGEE